MKTAKLILLLAIAIFLRFKADETIYHDKDVITDQEELTAEGIDWVLISDDTIATVYNAIPSQCNDDCRHTASMYAINMDNVLSDRIIAMERTMMAEYGICYGDVVLIEGAGRWDGIWQVQDTMNKRFAGQHKIDILVPRMIRHGKWSNVKVYVPGNSHTEEYSRNCIQSI